MLIFSKVSGKKAGPGKEKIDMIGKKVHETSEKKAKKGNHNQHQNEIISQREYVHKKIIDSKHIEKHIERHFVKIGIPGFDELFEKGIPKGAATLLCGGPGSGKTIFGLHTLYNAAKNGEKCIYMTFEENEDKLRQHMEDFRWDPNKLEKEGKLVIKKYDIYSITRSVEALLEMNLKMRGISFQKRL